MRGLRTATRASATVPLSVAAAVGGAHPTAIAATASSALAAAALATSRNATTAIATPIPAATARPPASLRYRYGLYARPRQALSSLGQGGHV